MLITGGARSGKSSIALKICNESLMKPIFLATAQALDSEMEERIRRHKAERGDKWLTVEEPLDIISRLKELDVPDTIILIDCLTLWLSNLFMKYETDTSVVYQAILDLSDILSNVRGAVIAVSNELGMGIVPENQVARSFRDAAGLLNQQVAAISKKVVVTFSGLPLVLKDE